MNNLNRLLGIALASTIIVVSGLHAAAGGRMLRLRFSIPNTTAQEMLNARLFAAVIRNNESEVRDLIETGAKVDAVDKSGYTPLHWAATLGNPVIAELLLNNGAYERAQDRKGQTPIDLANNSGHINVANFLENYEDYISCTKGVMMEDL